MKFKIIIIGLILVLFSGILVVSADTADINDYNFTMPEGYHIKNCSDDYVLLESDRYHTISICIMDSNTNRDVLKYMLEKSMYDFTYQDNYTKGSYDVEENYYNQEYQRGILYFCENADGLIVIDYKVPVIEDLENSPAEAILDSLE